jgi:hypothetical protein
MGIELEKLATCHVRISPIHVRLKCDVAGCWNLARAALEFADSIGRPAEHRIVCNHHKREEIEKVRQVVDLKIDDSQPG